MKFKVSTAPMEVAVAGATGYLGSHVVALLQKNGMPFKALARKPTKLIEKGIDDKNIIIAEATNPNTLTGCLSNVYVVISCLGITRQQDGLNYMDVDYQANLNLLEEAIRSGVQKFIYVSAFQALQYKDVRLLKAKEKFASRLLACDSLTPCVIRPNGFFSDMEEIYDMAKSGRVYFFGNGKIKLNPIHGKDLAKFCVNSIKRSEREIDVGGPDVLTANQIAEIAFNSLKKPCHVTYFPDSLRKIILALIRNLPEKWVGPIEFFLTVLGNDSVAPSFGEHHLKDHYDAMTEL